MIYAILREQLGRQMFIWAAGLTLTHRWGMFAVTDCHKLWPYRYLHVSAKIPSEG